MGNPFALPRPKTLVEKIARKIFDCLEDIDHDMADWLYYKEELEEAACEVLKMQEMKGIRPKKSGR